LNVPHSLVLDQRCWNFLSLERKGTPAQSKRIEQQKGAEMDFSSLLTVVGILLYGAYQYHQREQLHRTLLQNLREGLPPVVPETRPEVLKLWTTGIVSGILLLTALGFLFLRPRIIYGGEYVYILAFMFFTIFLLLLLILLRDIRARHDNSIPR
jgi:hypothetical protein